MVQFGGSTPRVVEPLDEGDDRALAAARGTNKRSHLSCSEEEAYSFEDLDIWAGRVAAFDVLEFNFAHNLFGCKAGRVCGVDRREVIDSGEDFGGCTHSGGYSGDLGSKDCEREATNHN